MLLYLANFESSTTHNASSRLLQLPTEVKKLIYELAMGGGQLIHVNGNNPYHSLHQGYYIYRPCCAQVSKPQAQRHFDQSSTALTLQEVTRHVACTIPRGEQDPIRVPFNTAIRGVWPQLYHGARVMLGVSNGIPSITSRGAQDLTRVKFNTAILGVCRQLYHEARYILYATNTFSFNSPNVLRSFLYDMQHSSANKLCAVRRLHLDMGVLFKHDEYAWNAALRAIPRKVNGLQRLHIGINQQFWVGRQGFSAYVDPNERRNNFLGGLHELKVLPIKRLTVVVGSSPYGHSKEPFGWTQAQKQEWARYVRDTILGSA